MHMQVWVMRSNQLVQHYSAHSGPGTNVAFHPSGDFLLSSSLDTTLKVRVHITHTCTLALSSCAHAQGAHWCPPRLCSNAVVCGCYRGMPWLLDTFRLC